MRKKILLKSILSSILILGTLFNIISCKKIDNTSSINDNNIIDIDNDEAIQSYTYKSDYILQDIEFDNMKIEENKIYLIKSISQEDKKKQHINIYEIDENGNKSEYRALDIEQGNIYDFSINKDKSITILMRVNKEINDDKENIKRVFLVKRIDEKGNELSSCELDMSDFGDEDGSLYISNIFISSDEKIYGCLSLNNSIFSYDLEGNLLLNVEEKNSEYLYDILVGKDNNIYYMYYNKNQETFFRQLDLQKKEGLKEYKIPNCNFISLQNNGEYDFYLNSESSVYGYKLQTEEMTKLFDWLDLDINSNMIDKINVLDNGQIICTTYDKEIIKIQKVLSSEVKEKQELILLSLDPNLKGYIIDFNKKSDKYRIRLLDYTEYEYEEREKQANLDIISGNIPDIIDISSISLERFVSKELFTDLYPIIEKDKDIKKEDFIDEILKAVEVKGKLYYIPRSFYIELFSGDKNFIGEKDSWNMNDMKQLYDNLDYRAVIDISLENPYMTRETILNDFCYSNISEYLDIENKKCNFNSENFAKLLEFVKSFPSEEGFSYPKDIFEKVKNNEIPLLKACIYDMSSYKMYETIFGKENCKFIGYPTNEGTGVTCIISGNYAITEKCNNKEGAWEFIKTELTYEYQKKNTIFGFPTRKDVLEKKFEQAMTTKEYVDEDGETIYPLESAMTTNYGVNITPLKKDEVKEIKKIISNIDRCRSYNDFTEQIISIILEEASTYFEGQKSLEEVLDIIQSRSEIYISENI